MVTSKKAFLKTLTVSLTLYTSSSFATKVTECSCKQLSSGTCASEVVKSPTWWGWLTGDTSTQFHFFQLIELLNSGEDVNHSVGKTFSAKDKKTHI